MICVLLKKFSKLLKMNDPESLKLDLIFSSMLVVKNQSSKFDKPNVSFRQIH